jgi:DNA-binding transcriptional MocR family regulator
MNDRCFQIAFLFLLATIVEALQPIASPVSCLGGKRLGRPLFGSLSSDGDDDSVGEATKRLGLDLTRPTVWTEFARLAAEYKKGDLVNLGQGFPDWIPPRFAVESLVEAVQDSAQSPHQYTRPAGHPNLVRQLAKRYSKHFKRDVDPMAEVAVTVGASQALYLSLQTLIQPGDQVILFEPFFE